MKRKRETKSVQLNIKVRPSFKLFLEMKANERGLSQSELIEMAVNLAETRWKLAESQKPTAPNWDWLVQ